MGFNRSGLSITLKFIMLTDEDQKCKYMTSWQVEDKLQPGIVCVRDSSTNLPGLSLPGKEEGIHFDWKRVYSNILCIPNDTVIEKLKSMWRKCTLD
jgi:hypothetical protein